MAEDTKQQQNTSSMSKPTNIVTFNISEEEEKQRLQKKLMQEKRLLDEKDKVMNETRESHRLKQESSIGRRSITINDVEFKVEELDIEKLTREQAKDIKEIEELQKQIEKLSGDLTLADVSLLDEEVFKLRPSIKARRSAGPATQGRRTRQLNNLQLEIDKYKREIELVKLKLQFKQ